MPKSGFVHPIIAFAFAVSLSTGTAVGIASVARSNGGAQARAACHYRTYEWNARTRRAEDAREVSRDYATLTSAERDSTTGCSVCEQDQVDVRLDGIAPFKACRAVADRVERALKRAIADGFAVRTVTGYRVGVTRGDVDAQGRRTGLSNHSFGVAFDINEASNGLYDRCVSFGPECRLIRGGAWRLGASGTVTEGDVLVRAFAAEGFAWGGAIAGRQKDFMHFSPTGY